VRVGDGDVHDGARAPVRAGRRGADLGHSFPDPADLGRVLSGRSASRLAPTAGPRVALDARLRRDAAGLEDGNRRYTKSGVGARVGRSGARAGIALLRLDAFASSGKGISLPTGDGMTMSARSQGVSFWIGAVALAAFVAADSPSRPRTFVGTITDTECGADHRPMIGRGGMGSTTASCTRACVSNGATYGFVDPN